MRKYLLLALAIVTMANAHAQWIRVKTLCDSYDGKLGYSLTDSLHYFNDGLRLDSIYGYVTNNEGESWTLDSRVVHTYDANGYPASSTMSNASLGEWNYSGQWLFTYDAEGHLLEQIELYYVEGTGWNNYLQTVFTYDENGFVEERTEYFWNGSDWEENYKFTYVNEVDGPVSHIAAYYYDGQWITEATGIYTYSEGVLILIETFDEMEEPLTMTEFEYDEDMNLIHEVISTWYSQYNAWLYSEDLMAYDEYSNLINEHGGYLDYSGGGTTYYYSPDCDHYYTYVTVDAPELDADTGLGMYPNPAVNEVRLDFVDQQGEVVIYDVAGNLVWQLNCQNSTVIRLDNFPAGLYYVSVRTSDALVTSRLVVAK